MLALAASDAPAGSDAPWSPARRVAFRFVFCYFGLYFFPPVPGLDEWWTSGCMRVTAWLAAHLLHLGHPLDLVDNGSGDTTAWWLFFACGGALALVATLIWSVADRRRAGHPRLAAGLHIYLRYAAALVMFTYGIAKVVGPQFPPLTPIRLLQRVGDLSPMGLMWTFMGYSRAYKVFSGLAELAACALLLFRRTSALGALVMLAVMTNVVLLNFCYDVPVKLYSTHLVLTALLLLAPDARRLWAALTAIGPSLPVSPRLRRARAIGKPVAIAVAFGVTLFGMLRFGRQFLAGTPPALDGAWEIESLVRNGRPEPRTLDDAASWRRLGFGQAALVIHRVDGGVAARFFTSPGDAAGTLSVRADERAPPGTLRWRTLDAEHVALDGSVGPDAVQARLRRIDTTHLELPARGFHLVNETYYNR